MVQNKKFDVVTLGEFLIDFTPAGVSASGKILFEANPGGAPANVAACISKLGKRAAFIGKLGSDAFGEFLIDALNENQIFSEGLIVDKHRNTALAFVHLAENGERSFTFYRDGSADLALRPDEIPLHLLDTRIFHFGSLSLTHDTARSATMFTLEKVPEGTLISYDPNLRPQLWKNLEEARKRILEVMGLVDILKIAEDELEFLTGTGDVLLGCQKLAEEYNVALILVTLGAKGCFYWTESHTGHVPGYRVTAVDSTGAGDAFLGAMLFQILEKEKSLSQWDKDELEECNGFANAVGALVVT